MTFYLYSMDGKTEFPPVDQALLEPAGLLAFGGDLSVKTLINAYSHGIFPWFSEQEPILWWATNPRMVLFPEKLHVSRRFSRDLKKNSHQVFFNRDFEEVMEQCSKTRKDGLGTWIIPAMKKAYLELHEQGFAHCLEIDIEGELAGGIYGVELEGVFFGESMFSSKVNGSKYALFELCKYLKNNDIPILDCQAHSSHLESMGAELISIEAFKKYLPAYKKAQGI